MCLESKLQVNYSARVLRTIDNGPAVMKSLHVGIFELGEDTEKQVGEYTRNYFQFFRTFFHFRKNGQDYALYSPHYAATRIMTLLIFVG